MTKDDPKAPNAVPFVRGPAIEYPGCGEDLARMVFGDAVVDAVNRAGAKTRKVRIKSVSVDRGDGVVTRRDMATGEVTVGTKEKP